MKTKKNERKYMFAAIDAAYSGIVRNEGGPFGAAVVKNDRIIVVAHNTVLKSNDATCHAEVNAIHAASKKLKRWNLKGCTIYSTTEPCPMCFSAIHWAQADAVVWGTEIPDVQRLGFNELTIPAPRMKKIGKSRVRLKRLFMRRECLELLEDWRMLNAQTY